MRILILGGTSEARELAEALTARGHAVIMSLAGRTSNPNVPAGEIRVGKFGGVPGLAGYLRAMQIEWVIDATHPYAALMSINAVAAARQAGIELIRPARDVQHPHVNLRRVRNERLPRSDCRVCTAFT